MSKLKTVYVCQQCGSQSVKWLGRCAGCGMWNTMVEEVQESPASPVALPPEAARPTLMSDVAVEEVERLVTGIGEFDRVLGGGIVPGSVTLVGGEPGIGKSTLLLGVAGRLVEPSGQVPVASLGEAKRRGQGREAPQGPVLYVSGEESLRQTKLRAARLGLERAPIHLMAQTRLEAVQEAMASLAPRVIIVDSIQVMETAVLSSAPGSVGQVRACAQALVRAVKESHGALFLVGHITKEGVLAGPKVLEHLVDTVLYFEGEPTSGFRVLRCAKNRFGATHELGVFHMSGEGLVEVSDPSELFVSARAEAVPGCMVTVTREGNRPLPVELQALISPSGMALPRRRTSGVDFNRVSMILAVLERRAGLRHLPQHDVFVSSLGGMQVLEPAADLGIALAIASSLKDQAVGRRDVAIGEVGLTGEVRSVSHLAQRLHEAKRVGFERCLVAAPRGGLSGEPEGMAIIPVRHVEEALSAALRRS